MKYNYQARSEDGQIQTGVVEAENKESAVSLLQKHGLYVTFVDEKKQSLFSKELTFFEKTSKKDVVLFSRQLSIMFKSGVPILESLRSLAKQTNKGVFREEITEIIKKIESGGSLSQGFSLFPKVFTPFYVGMVKSGEVSGRLSETLEYLADHLEREYTFNNKVMSAFIYPAFVVVVFLGILFFMTIFVVPRLGEIFGETELPFTTRTVLWFSEFLIQWWWVPIALTIALVSLFVRFIKTKRGKRTVEDIIFKVPVINDLVKKVNLVRIAENLSTMIGGGLPIVQAIEVTANIVGNESYKEVMLEARDGVRKGELVSATFTRHPDYFDPLFVEMIMVGEKTGKIDSSLKNVVSFYQQDVNRAIDGAVKLLEPIMIIVMGALVGFFVVSMLMPIYQMSI